MIPGIYLRPTDLDLAGTLVEFIRTQVMIASAAVNQVLPVYTIPLGKILIVQSLITMQVAGAAQWPVNVRSYHTAEINAYFGVRESGKVAAYPLGLMSSLIDHELWLPPGVITCESVYNAGVATNTLYAWITGWTIPRSSLVV